MRKKVIVAEMLYPEGHKALNEKYIKLLSEIADVTVLDNNNYFAGMNLPSGVNILKIKRRVPSVEKYRRFKKFIPILKFEPIEIFFYILNLFSIKKALKNERFDKLILMTARLDALAITLPFLPKSKIVVFHHNDIDRLLNRKSDQFFFKFSYNKYDHIFLAEFIRDGLKKIYPIKEDKSHIVYQPLIDGQTIEAVNIDERNNTVVGLGQTCDPVLLQRMITLDKESQCQTANRILLRDKKAEYTGNNVCVINRYLSREEFNDFLNSYAACILIYPTTFNLRYSGILDDALSHGMAVYGNDMPVVRYFHKKYPNSCHIFKSADELFNSVTVRVQSADKNEISQFILSHSDNSIISQFEKLL